MTSDRGAPVSPRPEQIAAAARALQPMLLELIALRADELADDLGTRLGMVAWEREEQIGAAQRRLQALEDQRVSAREHAGPCLVRELREQPLEGLELAWRALRQGRRVHVESESDACPGVSWILRELAEQFEGGALTASRPGELEHVGVAWEAIGVERHRQRIALIQVDADRELAAYVLARACLRRTGFDPRVVHQVIVAGPADRLERNLRRLWVGARMGQVDDEHAFAGPVDEERAERFRASELAWRAREGVTTICPGGRLQRADAKDQCFLAPALLRASPEALADAPVACGPMLVVVPIGTDDDASTRAEALLDRLAASERGRLRFGSKPRDVQLRPIDRQLHGALLVERMPPGLPEPRP